MLHLCRLALYLCLSLFFQQAPQVAEASVSRTAMGAAMGAALNANGATFRVWAPNAIAVSVKGDQTLWRETALQSEPGLPGVWSTAVSGVRVGDRYRYRIQSKVQSVERMDPESRQTSADGWSVVVDPLSYVWQSNSFQRPPLSRAVIYEMHIGSFNPETRSNWGSFRSASEKLDYLTELGINYVELLPLHQSARPYDWGYGPSLPDAIENTYGSPDDLRKFVDLAHQRGIGVLLDVVHNHYSRMSALSCFDADCAGYSGPYFYQNENATTPWGPRPNFADAHVRQYISGNIEQYLNEYRIDGFRFDAVPFITQFRDTDLKTKKSKLRGDNADGVSLLQQINQKIHQSPGIISIAEYFGAPASATQPVAIGGLGFDAHWAGFFPVTDAISKTAPGAVRISSVAAALTGPTDRVLFTESHDEVGHPPLQVRIPMRIDPLQPDSFLARKRSLLGAALLMTAPGIPMIFQGQEFLESQSFNFPTGTPLEWSQVPSRRGLLKTYHDLIALRKNAGDLTPALLGGNIAVFHQNENAKVLAYRRWDEHSAHQVVVLVNLGPQSFSGGYRFGVPAAGNWKVAMSTDDLVYSPDFGGLPHVRSFHAQSQSYDGFANSLNVEIAPFSAVLLIN
jgi:1,4-alpha-glucan branching enzyme